jgi:uncharacterized protein YdhG (YjbR/CyaY superfamily)
VYRWRIHRSPSGSQSSAYVASTISTVMATPRKLTPKTIDEYLGQVPPDSRVALQRLRKLIKMAAPDSEESIVYGLPTFRQGRMRLNIAAFKDHCSFYGWARVRPDFSDELKPFESGRGTLRFTPDRPLPAHLVTRIVRALVALDATQGSR